MSQCSRRLVVVHETCERVNGVELSRNVDSNKNEFAWARRFAYFQQFLFLFVDEQERAIQVVVLASSVLNTHQSSSTEDTS